MKPTTPGSSETTIDALRTLAAAADACDEQTPTRPYSLYYGFSNVPEGKEILVAIVQSTAWVEYMAATVPSRLLPLIDRLEATAQAVNGSPTSELRSSAHQEQQAAALAKARIALGHLSAIVMSAHPTWAFDGTTDLLCGWLREDYATAERMRAALTLAHACLRKIRHFTQSQEDLAVLDIRAASREIDAALAAGVGEGPSRDAAHPSSLKGNGA